MKCKDCEKYIATKDNEYGLCSLPKSYFPTKFDSDCCYLPDFSIKCKDCVRFKNDFACLTVNENDDASDCLGFIDAEENNVLSAFFVWLGRGNYSREKVLKLCDEFEQSEEYIFLKSIVDKEGSSGGK